MIPIDYQIIRSNIKVKGQAYFHMLGKGGISVLQTSLVKIVIDMKLQFIPCMSIFVFNSIQ